MATKKGSAGSGIAQATDVFGQRAEVGAVGEQNFADTLERLGLLRQYDSWFSVKVPKRGGNGRENADADIVLSTGRRILLIDVKMWSAQERTASGSYKRKTYWTIPFLGLPMVNFSPLRHGSNGEWRLSRSMEMARSRFSDELPGYQVESIVVFVPVGKSKHVPGVTFLRWPGGIKSYASGDAVRFIRSYLGRGGQKTGKEASALLSRMTV